jgi:1-acyl-sn-glycerol-3-phosphate acyltransferase
VLHGLHGVGIVLLRFPSLDRAGRRARIAWWAAKMLRCLGGELRVQGGFKPGAKLIVANHVSWLDSLLIGAHLPCCFVAKRELWGWPLVGPLLTASGAVPVERLSAEGLAGALEACTQRLKAGHSVCVFPEGTTTDGTTLRPFQRAFFECAVAADAPVLAVGLDYRLDGEVCTEVAWLDGGFGDSVRRAVALAPRLRAGLAWQALGAPAGRGRSALAEQAQAAVHALLGLPDAAAPAPAAAAPAAAPELATLTSLIAGVLQPDGAPLPDLAALQHRTWGELGLDSLDAMALLLAVEQHLGRPLPDAQLALFGTDRTIGELVQGVLKPA